MVLASEAEDPLSRSQTLKEEPLVTKYLIRKSVLEDVKYARGILVILDRKSIFICNIEYTMKKAKKP